jgi:hypothetical protein
MRLETFEKKETGTRNNQLTITLFLSSARHSKSARNNPTHPPPAITMGRRSSDDAIMCYLSNEAMSYEGVRLFVGWISTVWELQV